MRWRDQESGERVLKIAGEEKEEKAGEIKFKDEGK